MHPAFCLLPSACCRSAISDLRFQISDLGVRILFNLQSEIFNL
jgi:hypothetical protein